MSALWSRHGMSDAKYVLHPSQRGRRDNRGHRGPRTRSCGAKSMKIVASPVAFLRDGHEATIELLDRNRVDGALTREVERYRS